MAANPPFLDGPTVFTPSVLVINEFLKKEIPRNVNVCIDKFTNYFMDSFPECTRMDLIVALVDLYGTEGFIGVEHAARRIIVHYLLFLSNGISKYLNDEIWFFNRKGNITPAIALLLKVYGTAFGSGDCVFSKMTDAERQFIGRLMGYSIAQRRAFLLDETPISLVNVLDDNPHITAASSVLRQKGVMRCLGEVYRDVNRGLQLFQYEIKEFKSGEEPGEPLVVFTVENVVPIDYDHNRSNRIANKARSNWVPVPQDLCSLPYDASVMYAPPEFVDRLQREHEVTERMKATQENITRATEEAAAAEAANRKRQTEEQIARSQANHKHAFFASQNLSSENVPLQPVNSYQRNAVPVLPPPIVSMPPNPVHPPVSVHPSFPVHPPVSVHAPMSVLPPVPIAPQMQSHIPFNPNMPPHPMVSMPQPIPMMAGVQPQPGMMPPVFVNPFQFNSHPPMMEFPPPPFMYTGYYNPVGNPRRRAPGYYPQVRNAPRKILNITSPTPPTPTPVVEAPKQEAPIQVRKPESEPIDSKIIADMQSPPPSKKPKSRRSGRNRAKSLQSRKLNMSEMVKRNLSPAQNQNNSPEVGVAQIKLCNGDSNIEQCLSEVLALVSHPVVSSNQPTKKPILSPNMILNALRHVFEGELSAIRHEHWETVKTYFEESDYELIRDIKVTHERIIECITINPNAMGVGLAFLLRSGETFVYDFIVDLISGNFCSMTVVVLVRFLVEIFRFDGTVVNKKFTDNVITTCLSYLNDPITQEIRTSADGRLVRLTVTLLYMHILYMPDEVEHRMDELLSMTMCYTSLRFSSSIFHAINLYRQKTQRVHDFAATSAAFVKS